MARLHNKVALVTGAGGGIGRAYALALAAEGAHVVVNDFGDPDPVVAEIEASGSRAIGHRGDVSKFSDARSLVQSAIDTFGTLDIVIANAGILRPGNLHEMSEEDWTATFAVHAGGTFNVYRHAVPHMIRQDSGTIITTGAAPLEGYYPRLAAYRAAKAAILVMTMSAANELAGYNININSIMPASTDTPMQRSYVATLGEKARDWPKGWAPETIPPLGVFLCTDEGRRISGYAFHAFGPAGIKIVTSFGTRSVIEAAGSSWAEGELAARVPQLLDRAKEAHLGLHVA